MPGRLAAGVVALALVLPWTTTLRLSAPTAEAAMLATPLLLFSLAALGSLALLLAATDPWLGAFVAYAAALVLWTGSSYALETAQWIAFGAWLLYLARGVKAGGRAVDALVMLALAQTGYVGLQTAWLDPLFTGTVDWTRVPWPAGTLGNPTWTAALLALVVPLATPGAAVVLLVGLVLTKSTVGIAAALVGLALRWRARWTLALLVAGAVIAPLVRNITLGEGLAVRRDVALLGLAEWWGAGWAARLLGVGPGEWYTRIPAAQHRTGVGMLEGPFVWAHSDVVQLAYEFGLVGLATLAGWCWRHRAIFTGPYAGALAALAIQSAVFFPWHLPCVAAVALVVLALATPAPDRKPRFVIDLSRRVACA